MKKNKNKGSKSIGSRIKAFYEKYKKPILIIAIGGPGVYLAYRVFQKTTDNGQNLLPPPQMNMGGTNKDKNSIEDFMSMSSVEEVINTPSPIITDGQNLKEQSDISAVSFDF